MNYLEHIAIFAEKYENYLFFIIILLPFLLSLFVLFGSDDEISDLPIFENMKKLEIKKPDINIEIIEENDKITKNINIKADEMDIEYQENNWKEGN